MKVSLNWLKDYIDISQTPQEISHILTDIGLEVEGEEEVEAVKGGLKGVVVGHVLTCGKHPGADKLSLTTVDVGGEEPIQIVCGAPNVAQGQKVLVATVGTTLYSPEGEEWKIKKGKIRGEVSMGMICAEDELGLGQSHDGIMVLAEDAVVGTPAADFLQIESDYVYDIGLTPNRSDATCHLGTAKDLAAYLKVNGGMNGEVQVPDVAEFKADESGAIPEIVIESTEACPRFSGVVIKGLETKPSPEWLVKRLEAIGVKSINNIVDITNFILHELGQPLHAYDLSKIAGNKIVVKSLAAGTPFKTLDDVEIKLLENDLMICDGEEKPMCMAGVYGGLDSGVTDTTTDIFLESAHFNAGWIRRSSMKHNLRTDAAKVFEKGSDPNITVLALKRAASLLKELANGTIASDIVDIYPTVIEPKQIDVKFKNVTRLVGVDIASEDIVRILEAMEMEIVSKNEEGLTVAVPTNKADVLREADVIEEILRIYGFNNVPIPNTVQISLVSSRQPDPNLMRNTIGDYLAANGYNEMMAVSLSRSQYYKEIFSDIKAEELVYINNTSNVHLDIMRPEMAASGLEVIGHNVRRKNLDMKLFEFGRYYRKDGDKYVENEQLSLFVTGTKQPELWLNKGEDADYYTLKAMVEELLTKLGVANYQSKVAEDEIFAYGMTYHQGRDVLVSFGKVNTTIAKKMDVDRAVYYAAINWEKVYQRRKKHKIVVEELNKFPTMRRDLALVVDKSVKFADIAAIAAKTGKKLLKKTNLFDVYENAEQLGEGKKSYAVSFVFENIEKTLKDKEVDKIMNNLIQNYESQLGALIRR